MSFFAPTDAAFGTAWKIEDLNDPALFAGNDFRLSAHHEPASRPRVDAGSIHHDARSAIDDFPSSALIRLVREMRQ